MDAVKIKEVYGIKRDILIENKRDQLKRKICKLKGKLFIRNKE